MAAARRFMQTAADKAARFTLKEQDASAFPRGYVASGIHCGIKKNAALDLGVLWSLEPASAAACFTKNKFWAAPVTVSKEVLEKRHGKARAIVVNSGCANAVTGRGGLEDAWNMSHTVDKLVARGDESTAGTMVLSTGVIGQRLPIKRILDGIQTAHSTASSSFGAWDSLAKAFMTTDTFPKLRTRSFELPNGTQARFVGIDKGAGMIHPRLGPPHATLLGLIATDAAVEPKSLQDALTYAVDRSFNSISVDGDMSTNDTVLAMANGAAGGPEISASSDPELFARFREELTSFAIELASLLVRDGEGATKFVRVTVEGAPSYQGAHEIASTISRSSLVKTALHGEDANWGRILCAVGYATPDFDVVPSKTSVSFVPTDGSAPLKLLVNGEPENVDEVRAKEILQMEDLEILVELGLGTESAT